MKLSPIQRRAQRAARNQSNVDLNLVALIDIFTILIFFLLSNSGVELLTTTRSVRLPESTSIKLPEDTAVVIVNATEIVVDGRRVANVAEVLNAQDDLIAPLKAELEPLAARQTIRKENEAKGRTITILGDKDIPYRLLRKVMVTCARAGFSDVSFAVQRRSEV
jgi:biopolymer transport protein ExbD